MVDLESDLYASLLACRQGFEQDFVGIPKNTMIHLARGFEVGQVSGTYHMCRFILDIRPQSLKGAGVAS